MIQTPEKLDQLCQELSKEPMIALDTEFIRERTYYPNIALIQVASSKKSFLIDPLAFSPKQLKPLLKILQNKKILKILHAAQADQECFLVSYNCLASPIFDTAEAAALCGFGESPGLASLVTHVLGVNLRKGSARAHWKQRPLPPELIKYALADVDHLIPLTQKLMEKLKGKKRLDWAMELSQQWADPDRFYPNPQKIAKDMVGNGRVDPRGYLALQELATWREELAQKRNIPRRRIADNATLISLANVRPTSIEHLESFRGLNAKDIKDHGESLVKKLKKIESLDPNKLPKLPKQKPLSSHQKRVADFLRLALEDLSHQLRIAPQRLLPAEKLSAIVRGSFKTPEDLVETKILSSQIFELIGPFIWALLQSKKGLTLDKGRLKLVDL